MPAVEVPGWLASRWREALVPVARAQDRPARTATGGLGLVLVVDDDPTIVGVIGDILRGNGYTVATAANGEEALTLVGKTRPAVVLLDLHMPKVDGGAFAEALRERGISIPIVVMTAGPNAHLWAERLKASGHLAKPFGVDQLLLVTERAIATAPRPVN